MPDALPAVATASGALPPLPTVDILGLDVLLPGVYTGIEGGTNQYDVHDLDDFAAADRELNDLIQPVAKLGHKRQGLLAGEQLPNAGRIKNVRRVGSRLKVDLVGVPGKIAQLVKAGGYGARSAEILFDARYNGKTYKRVLTGLALLGEDAPAVKGLNDILALYEDAQTPAMIALSESAAESVTVELAAAVTKSESDGDHPASDYAYVPDPDKPSTWKLRIDDTAHIGAAAAALGPGYRGQKADIPDADRAAVVAKVRAAWKKANPDKEADDMPEGIKLAEAEPQTDSEKAQAAMEGCENPAHADMPDNLHKKLHMPKKASHSARRPRLLSSASYTEIQAAVQDALEEAYPYVYQADGLLPSGNSADGPSSWIECLYDDSVVVWDQDHDQLWQLPYEYDADSDTATLGDPVRCRLVPQAISGAAYAAKSSATPGATEDTDGGETDYGQHIAGLESALNAVSQHLDGLKNQRGVGPARMMHRELAGKVAAMKGRLVKESAPSGDGGLTTEGNTSAETPLDANQKPGGGARLQEGETMQDSELRALLSLGPDEDIKQALIAMNARKVELSDYQAAIAERDQLKAERSKAEATALVDDAINAGKLVPKMRDWAISLAEKDRESLTVYLSSATGFFAWPGAGEAGVSGETDAKRAPNPQALEIAKRMGIDPAVAAGAMADQRSAKDKYIAQLEQKGVTVLVGAGKGN